MRGPNRIADKSKVKQVLEQLAQAEKFTAQEAADLWHQITGIYQCAPDLITKLRSRKDAEVQNVGEQNRGQYKVKEYKLILLTGE